MFENVWLSGQMHTKFAQMTPTFFVANLSIWV